MTPYIGTEIRDCQLSSLVNQQKDELALYVAERGLLVFRDQDFVDHGAEWMKDYGSYFGRLHVHPFGTHPKDHPELTTNFRESGKKVITFVDALNNNMLTTTMFHSDMGYGSLHLLPVYTVRWRIPVLLCRSILCKLEL